MTGRRDVLLGLLLRACDTTPFEKYPLCGDALGKPRTSFLFLGHYTAYLSLPYLKYAAWRFFEQTLGGARPPEAASEGTP